jgi:PAS domain S-box-containing protein
MKELLKFEVEMGGQILRIIDEEKFSLSLNSSQFEGKEVSAFYQAHFSKEFISESGSKFLQVFDGKIQLIFSKVTHNETAHHSIYQFFSLDSNAEQSEEQLKFLSCHHQIFENQPITYLFVDNSGQILWANAQFKESKDQLKFQESLNSSVSKFGSSLFDAWAYQRQEIYSLELENQLYQIAIHPVFFNDLLLGFRLEISLSRVIDFADLASFPAKNPNPVLRISETCDILFSNPAAGNLLQEKGELAPSLKKELLLLIQSQLISTESFAGLIEFNSQHYRIDFFRERNSWNLFFVDITEASRMTKLQSITQAQIEAIINSSRSAVILINPEKEISYFNQKARQDSKRYFGFDIEEGAKLDELIEGSFARTIEVSVQTVLKAGHQITFDLDFDVSDEKRVWFSFTVYPIKGAQSEITGACLNITNITKGKLAEIETKKTKDFYETVLNNIPADIAVFDLNHKYMFLNLEAVANDELRKWLIGKTDYDFFERKGSGMEIADARRAVFNEVITTKKTNDRIDAHTKADGSICYKLRRFYPYEEQGEMKLVIGYGLDITELKEAERQFQLSESKFRSLFENNPMLIFIVDQNFNVASINKAAKQHFNIDEKEISDVNMLSLIREDFCSEFTAKFSQAFGMNEGESHTCYCHLKQGTHEFSVEFSATPILSESGEKLLMLVGADHTERLLNEERLKKSEVFNRHLIQQIPIPFAIVDFDRAELINDAMRKLFALPAEIDYKSLSLLNFIDEEHRKSVRQAISDRYAGKDSGAVLLRIYDYERTPKIVEVQGALMEIEGRKLNFLTMIDKTAELHQSKLRKSAELKAQQIIDTALDAVVSTDSQGLIQIWNPKAELIFGWTAEEIKGQNIVDTIIPQFHRNSHSFGMDAHMKTGKSNVLNTLMELTAVNKSGHEFPIEIFITRIEIEGEIIFSSFIRDVSLKKQAELQLVASENKLSLLVQSLPVLPFTMSHNNPYEFTYLNERVESLLGYNEVEIAQTPNFWLSKIHPDDVKIVKQNVLTFDSSKQNVLVYRILHSNGHWKWLRETSKLLFNSNGEPISISGVFNDITQQKETDDRRQKVENTLYEISREERVSTDSLNEFYSMLFAKLNENFGFTSFSLWELGSDRENFKRIAYHSFNKENISAELIVLNAEKSQLLNEICTQHASQNDLVNGNPSAILHDSLNTIFNLNESKIPIISLVKTDLSNGLILLLENNRSSFEWQSEYASFVGSISELISFNLEYFHRIEADQKLRKAYSLAKIGAWEIEEGRDSVYWSEAMFEFYGLVANSTDPLKFDAVLKFIHPDDLDHFSMVFNRLLNDGIPYKIECRHVLPDLPVRFYEKSAVAITSISGKRIFMGVTVDITDRKIAEQEKTDRLQRKTISNAVAASISLAADLQDLFLRFTEALHNAQIVNGCMLYSDDDEPGVFLPKMIYPEAYQALQPAIDHVQSELNMSWVSLALNETSYFGDQYPNRIIAPVQMPGRGRCYFLFDADIEGIEKQDALSLFSTLIKSVQEKAELIHAENQLRLLNNELLDTNVQLRQYSYIVSHNLRAPVANILGCINLYNEEDPADSRNEELINGLKISANSVDNILRDLNKILNIKENVFRQFEVIQFQEIFDFVLENLKNEISKIPRILDIDFSEATEIKAFKPYMVSVFQNLISNAFKYRAADRDLKLKIKSSTLSGKLILTISDNGRGIDLEKHGSKLFKLYSRLHTDVPGTGLGLTMVQEQVRVMGGNIQIESKEGEGTTFMLTFTIKQ